MVLHKSIRRMSIASWAVFAVCLFCVAAGAQSWQSRTLSVYGKGPVRVAFSPDGGLLAVVINSNHPNVTLWDVKTGRVRHTLHVDTLDLYCVAFSPDSSTLAIGDDSNAVDLWDVRSGKLKRILQGDRYGNRVYGLAFSPNGKILAGACYHGFVELWDVQTGKLKRQLGDYLRAWEVAFSPDGKTIAAAVDYNGVDPDYPYNPDKPQGPGAVIKLWDARTGELLRTLSGKNEYDTIGEGGVAFSADGRRIATGGERGLQLWDVRHGKRQRIMGKPSDDSHEINSIAFSPDGRTVAVGRANDVVELWDVWRGRLKRRLKQGSEVLSVAFSPDGRTLAICDEDNGVKLWRIK